MRIEEVHKDVDTYAYVHMVSLMRCCVYTHVLSQKKKKNVLRGMLGGWCVRDTSLLCTVHPLSFKHSDHCVRVDPSTSPYHCPALAPVWRVTCFFLVARRVYVSYRLQEAYGKLYGPPVTYALSIKK